MSAPPAPVGPDSPGDDAWRGDLVVTSGPTAPLPDRRGSWARVAGGDGWAAWRSGPSPGWAGYRIAPVPAPGWDGWFVGEGTVGSGPAAAAAILVATAAAREAEADALAAALHGSWLLVARDGLGTWHVWSDRFATIHGFVGRSGPRVAIGTSQEVVAAAVGDRAVDWDALIAWCALGFFPGDRTGEARVRVVRPATHDRHPATGSAPSSHRYWWWEPQPDRRRSVAATVTALDDVLAEVLGQQAAGLRLAIPISGGLDSRTTLAVLTAHDDRRQGGELWGYSYGYQPDSVETGIAARLATVRDLPFTAWTIRPYLLDELDRACRILEGAQDLTQSRQLAVIDEVADRADRVVAAHWGDVWLDDMGFADQEATPDAVLAQVQYKFTKSGGRWLVGALGPAHVADPAAVVSGLLESEFAPYRDIEGADARARAFKTDQWSFRWTVPSLRAHHAGLTPRLPFYDGRVAELMATVPDSMVAGRALQIEHLRRTAPDLARVTWQQSGASLTSRGRVDAALAPARRVRRVARRVRRTVLGAPVLERNWEVQFGGDRRRQQLRDVLLGPDSVVPDLVPVAAVEQLLVDMDDKRRTAEAGETVSMLFTLAAWLERR